jgi:glutamate-1-semialdehyde 2,1-aminomutase
MGLVPPLPGFNRFLSERCAAAGALLVSDEVMTGFRLTARGKWATDGAVEGWKPDLMAFGKVMGGGFPAAAFGGRADVMAHLAPGGGVYQAGTLSGNPVAATAGLTTLRLATEDVYTTVDRAARVVRDAAAQALEQAGVPHLVQADGTMFSVFLPDLPLGSEATEPVTGYAGAQAQRTDRFAAFFHAMLDQGVYLPPSAFEVWFLSAAHDSAALDRVVSALPVAARAAALS